MVKITRHPVFILALLLVIFFFRQIFSGEVIYCCDNLSINIPSKIYLIDQLKSGHFPLWNPYNLSGTPFLADINLALLYPLNLLYFFLSPFRALTWSIIISVFVSLTGTFLVAKSFKQSNLASIAGAIVFGFSGMLVTYTNNIPLLQTASLLPWVFWGVKEFMDRQNIKALIIASVLAALQVFAGHPQLTYLTWLLIFTYFIWLNFAKKRWVSDLQFCQCG